MKHLIGMFTEAAGSLLKKTATVPYPVVRNEVPKRYHGRLDYDPTKCMGCMLCMKDCPAQTITIHIIDRKAKQFVMSYNIGHCIYCKQCVQNCKFGALSMTNQMWETAAPSKDSFQCYFGKQEYIDGLLAKQSAADAAKPEAQA